MPPSRISAPVTRFAPSPSGYLHIGHAYAAIMAFRQAGSGGFVLRIEDLDRGRARPQYAEAILEDLAWLGLGWREPVLLQSSRAAAYGEALGALARRGLTYPCFCTRASISTALAGDIAAAAEAPHPGLQRLARYPGTCRHLSAPERDARLSRGEPHVLRLDAALAAQQPEARELMFVEQGEAVQGQAVHIRADPALLGDIVLARKDLPAAYHLAVVLDDAFQHITLVTRGEDLLPSTHVQRLLQALLGLPVPRYAHHRLILDEQGRKFSKRDRAPTLRSLREAGSTAAMLIARLGL
jgi:glutamyl-Q tRNA(Asp) synthetase